ncbi:GntP family permease [Nonomuraea jiangxiensis]|uniref:H+/gluconate symporter n=1 Tax=Nonomuraea jiangxiensis TaxID=633440 RepID=A0A1G8DHV7_9ACTN|nr:SLC13 family permease [Nonomuraea jiangxiensis]SDH57252.1 H+/gluconate symporter [Nonomuraea jiangxiensis]
MSDIGTLANTAVAVVGIVVLIVRFRVNPVVALVIGAGYLGLAAGIGVARTAETITAGFGEIMAGIGLLVAFGVLMGAILRELGAIERLVRGLLRVFGPRRVPYAMSLTIATLLQSIFLDVMLVISAPLARGLARKLDRYGTARMATALAIGLESGIIFTVPGVGALALAALLHVPLGTYLLFGLIVVIPTVLVATAISTFILVHGWWKPEADEEPFVDEPREAGPVADGVAVQVRDEPRLVVLFGPMLVALALVATGALAKAAKLSDPALAFVSTPVIALLIGMVGTFYVGRRALGQDRVEQAMARGLKESGPILLLNGVGGSLAAMIKAAGLGAILGKYLSAGSVAPLIVVWVIAAVLHVAVGSVTISAITSAGLLAPLAPALGIDPVLVALAAGAGSLFMVHLTSNTFWLLQSLLGQSTRGTLKTCTVGVSVASVVAMGPILALSLVL